MIQYDYLNAQLKVILDSGRSVNKNFVIYPFGRIGMTLKEILNKRYFIKEKFIIDNELAQYSDQIRSLESLAGGGIDVSQYTFLIASLNEDIWDEIRDNLKKYVDEKYIIDLFPKKPLFSADPHIASLELASREIYEKNIEGAVAEAGVWKGNYAYYINKFFWNRKLYLFDTFEGFTEDDVNYEYKHGYSFKNVGAYSDTSPEAVLARMQYKNNIVIRKGIFPDTCEGLEEKFCFVNLDMDLFKPIYAGLKYFYPRIVRGGYIFVHDCCIGQINYKGAREALLQFCNENNIGYVMLPDNMTAVIAK